MTTLLLRLRRACLSLLCLILASPTLALTSYCNIGPVSGGYDTIYHLASWNAWDAYDYFDYVSVQSDLTAPFLAQSSSSHEAGYGGSVQHPLPNPDDGYHAATGYVDLGAYAFDSCSVSGYIDNVSGDLLELEAWSGSNTVQGGVLTIRQDDKLDLQLLADGPLVCDVVTGVGGGEVEIVAESNGTGYTFPAYTFDVGTTWVSASCPGFEANGFELQVLTPINPAPTTPAATITSASLKTHPGGVNVNGSSFTINTELKVEWSSSNADACFIRTWNIQQYPVQNGGTVLPAGHFDLGEHQFSFYCAGSGGVSATQVFEFEVLSPSGNPSVEPGFRGAYEATIGNVNNDGKSDIRIKPASGNTDSGVGEFVLVSNPGSPGYQVLGPQGSWGSVSTIIDLVTGDFDADGLDDLIIKNISGADDVIVYAPRFPGGKPRDYVEVDDQFKQFFEELYGQLVDPDYFDNHTYTDVQDYFYWQDFDGWGPCTWGFTIGPITLNACNIPGGFNMPTMVLERSVTLYKIIRMENGDIDYRDFHPATDHIRGVLRNDFNTGVLQTGEVVAESWQAERLEEALSGVLRRKFAAGALSTSNGVLPNNVSQGFVFAPIIPVLGEAVWNLSALLRVLTLAWALTEIDREPLEIIYRVYGGCSGLYGSSWTPFSPEWIALPQGVFSYRDYAGLPQCNNGSFLATALLRSPYSVSHQPASPIINDPPGYSVQGGLLEYVFIQPVITSIELLSTHPVYPPY